MAAEVEFFRSAWVEQFPEGTVINEKPAPEVLFLDFEPRLLPSGTRRKADVRLSSDSSVYVGNQMLATSRVRGSRPRFIGIRSAGSGV